MKANELKELQSNLKDTNYGVILIPMGSNVKVAKTIQQNLRQGIPWHDGSYMVIIGGDDVAIMVIAILFKKSRNTATLTSDFLGHFGVLLDSERKTDLRKHLPGAIGGITVIDLFDVLVEPLDRSSSTVASLFRLTVEKATAESCKTRIFN